jgi:hypothetical protein
LRDEGGTTAADLGALIGEVEVAAAAAATAAAEERERALDITTDPGDRARTGAGRSDAREITYRDWARRAANAWRRG